MLLPEEKIRLLSVVDAWTSWSHFRRKSWKGSPGTFPTSTSGGQTIYKPEYRSEALFMLKNGRERIPKVAPGRVRAHAR